MKNINSLKNKEFSIVYNKGKSYANKYLIMYVLDEEKDLSLPERVGVHDDIRLGISVSKKVGNSIVRHRSTRLIREVFRLNKDLLNSGLSMVIIGRPGIKDKKYDEVESAFLHLAKLHNIMK